MKNEAPTDEVYYRAVGSLGLAQRAALLARQRIYRDFISLVAPKAGESILDVGVADVTSTESNILEALYPHRDDITCAGLGDGTAVLRAYPGVTYKRITAGAPLPFADKSFAIATSNAVLEHVGSDGDRRFFLREMLRVAHRVFVSIPNRWFPVEHHTALPLLHYFPPAFYDYCRRSGRDAWSTPHHLRFLSRTSFRRLWPLAANVHVLHTGLPLGPFSSNLVGISGVGPVFHSRHGR